MKEQIYKDHINDLKIKDASMAKKSNYGENFYWNLNKKIRDNLEKVMKNKGNIFLGLYHKVLTSIIKIIKNRSPLNSELNRSNHF